MKQKTKLLLRATFLMFAIIMFIYRDWIYPIFSHLIHTNPLSFHNVEIDVPIEWLVMEQKENSVVLVKKGAEVSLLVRNYVYDKLNKENISENDLSGIIIDNKNIKVTGYGKINVHNKNGHYVDLINNSQTSDWKYMRILAIPTASIQFEFQYYSDKITESDLDILKSIVIK